MAYQVDCPCGAAVVVTAPQAGSRVACRCGATLDVPPLSRLRRAVGQGDYEAGPIDTVLRLIASGALPSGDLCVVSGRPTTDVLMVRVEAERLQWSGVRGPWLFLGAMLVGPLAIMFARPDDDVREVQGRETTLEVPVRVHRDCHDALARRTGPRRLRALLRAEPAYARLLDHYPRASVSVAAVQAPRGVYDPPLSPS